MTEKGEIVRGGRNERWIVYGVVVAVVFLAGLGTASGSSSKSVSLRSNRAAFPTVKVTAGKPTELSFTLSNRSPSAGTVVFEVTNKGKIVHTFKVCSAPSKIVSANSCAGKATKLLRPGANATVTVTLGKGAHEYLSTVPGQAAAGMKGVISVGSGAAPPPGGARTTTTPVTSTGPPAQPAAKETLIGDPVDGATVYTNAGCGTCHTLAAAGSTGNYGPDLDNLAPNQTTIVDYVVSGGAGHYMPAFASVLNMQQINDVAAYVYQSTHPGS